MDELIKKVTDKAGIPADKAQAAVDTVVQFLKDKLPGPLGSQLDQILQSGGSGLGEIVKGLGDMFGKK